jgi:hypothetical protein
MTSAAAPESPAGRRRLAAFLLLFALLAILAGLSIRPAGASYRWNIGAPSDGPSTGANALAIAKAYHRRHRRLEHLLALTFRLEGRGDWLPGARIGCNDRWTVSVRTLFGIRIARTDIHCDGVEVVWGDADARPYHDHR